MTRAPHRCGAAPVLSVGVVGHRDLGGADPVPLRAAAGALFAEIRRRAAADAGLVRLRCICNAAAGADTILGEAALAMGFELLCLLPVPRAVFAHDFSTETAPTLTWRRPDACTRAARSSSRSGTGGPNAAPAARARSSARPAGPACRPSSSIRPRRMG